MAAVGTLGVGVRRLLAARAADGALGSPGTLVLGAAAGGAMGLAFAPFAIAGVLPVAVSIVVLALVLAMLLSTLAVAQLLQSSA